MRPSRWIASAALVLVVPASIWLAFAGHDRGLYADWAVPIALAATLALASTGLFLLLGRLRAMGR